MPFVVLVAVSIAAALAQAVVISRRPLVVAAARATIAGAEGGDRRRTIQDWLAACRHPAAATAVLLCLSLVASVLGWLLVGSLAFLVRTQNALLHLDSGVAEWGSENATAFSTRVLEALTLLGDTRVVTCLAVVLLVTEALRARLRLRVAAFVVAAVVGNNLITSLVKDLMDRARPALNPIAHTLGPSFPSGHSSTAAAFYLAAAVVLARRRSHRTFTMLTSIAAGISVAVACTRVLLDVHWLSDVVAGLALGWAWVTLCAVVLGNELLTPEPPRGRPRRVQKSTAERATGGSSA